MSDIRYQETRTGLESLVPRGTRWLGGGLVALAAGVVLAAGCRPAEQVDASVPAGTTMVAALDDRVSTEHLAVGDKIELTTTEAIPLEGDAMLPEGTTVVAEVTQVTSGDGTMGAQPALTLQFTALEVNGDEYPIETEPLEVKGGAEAEEKPDVTPEARRPDTAQPEVPAPETAWRDTVALGIPPRDTLTEVLTSGAVVPTRDNEIVLTPGQRVEIRLAQAARVKVPREPARQASNYQ